jgi:hypothetical protein
MKLLKLTSEKHVTFFSRYIEYKSSYGLNSALALASVTSIPADAAGLGHRIGTLSEGQCVQLQGNSPSTYSRFRNIGYDAGQ